MSTHDRDVRALEALIGPPPESSSDHGQPFGPSAGGLGHALVEHFGSLRGLLVSRRAELVAAGLTPEVAHRIAATRRLAAALVRRRRSRRLLSPRLVVRQVPHLSWHPIEEIWVISVDGTMRALGCTLVARGNSASCAVTPGEIFGPALRHRARGVFVVHNHPSGDPTPSPTDLVFTERLREASKLLALNIEDHLVVGGGRFASIMTRRRGDIAWPSFEPRHNRLRPPARGSDCSIAADRPPIGAQR